MHSVTSKWEETSVPLDIVFLMLLRRLSEKEGHAEQKVENQTSREQVAGE